MHEINSDLLGEIRARFAHVETCPYQGERIFFESAGGALTLKSVVETSAKHAAIPDNQGRDNPASQALMEVIAKGRDDMMTFLGAHEGQVFVGESGTELLFRMIRTACLNAPEGAGVIGSSLEHPASRSPAKLWAERLGLSYINVQHDDATGNVTPEAYRAAMTPDVAVATVVHNSPVTGMSVDLAGIAEAIRAVAPDCLIIVDGIQHAAHGGIAIGSYGIDGYAVSPYKVFSRHGYGVAWISDRLSGLAHEALIGGPATGWELGTRDAGAYATLSDVVDYFDWLGGEVSDARDRRARIEAASAAIHAQEARLCDAILHGTGNLPGLADLPGVTIIGGEDNPAREGLVSFTAAGHDAPGIVASLNARGIRTHMRKADHYSGNVLEPLGLEHCVRVSLCHYNSEAEIARLLTALRELLG